MSSTLPAGVVTFLFMDVEGSTKLLHELGNAYADALHEHRRLLREAFTAHRMRSLQPLTRSWHSRVARSVCEWACTRVNRA